MQKPLSSILFVLSTLTVSAAELPNILWITAEDHGPHMGCYGDKNAVTPNVDALAAKGMLFTHAWSCAPVCAPARTTIISGMFPPSLGAEHMRSEVPMPKGAKMYPQYLREVGYYCSNNSKEDYNLTKPGEVWDESSGKAHWKNRGQGQPFFAIFNSTVSHESKLRVRPHQQVLDPAKIRVPAYHPDTPEVRQDWAQYYDTVSEADAIAGKQLKELADAGLTEDIIVFYYADHGSGMPRNKRWPCNSGLQVPMVVYFPPKWQHLAPKEYKAGGKSDRLVSFVDLAPTLLSIAGIKPPKEMQGHAFAGKYQEKPQPFIYGFRGRMDERIDFVRSLTDGRYVYLRNYMPYLSQGQHVNYQFQTPTTRVWYQLFTEGKLNDAQSIFWRTPKAPEELYDLQSDPDEVNNLASSPKHRSILRKLRRAQEDLALKVRDTGFLTEAEVHARSGDQAPYDALSADSVYPIKRVMEAAGVASSLDPDDLPKLKKFLHDEDSGVRYWGAMGILMRGAKSVTASTQELGAALKDGSASVRIAAAEALGTYGGPKEQAPALAALRKDSDPTKSSAYAATAAMNVIDRLGKKADSLVDFVKTMPTKDPKAVGRANEYVARLRETVLEAHGQKITPPSDSAPKGKARAKGKAKAKKKA